MRRHHEYRADKEKTCRDGTQRNVGGLADMVLLGQVAHHLSHALAGGILVIRGFEVRPVDYLVDPELINSSNYQEKYDKRYWD